MDNQQQRDSQEAAAIAADLTAEMISEHNEAVALPAECAWCTARTESDGRSLLRTIEEIRASARPVIVAFERSPARPRMVNVVVATRDGVPLAEGTASVNLLAGICETSGGLFSLQVTPAPDPE